MKSQVFSGTGTSTTGPVLLGNDSSTNNDPADNSATPIFDLDTESSLNSKTINVDQYFKRLNVIEGQPVIIECKSYAARPAANVSILTDFDSQLYSTRNYKFLKNQHQIVSISKGLHDQEKVESSVDFFDTSARYSLIPTKEMHNKEISCKSSFDTASSSRETLQASYRINLLSKPEVSTQIINKKIIEGDTIEIYCQVTDGNPISPDSLKFSLVTGLKSHGQQIILKDNSHVGHFKITATKDLKDLYCQAENLVGKSESEFIEYQNEIVVYNGPYVNNKISTNFEFEESNNSSEVIDCSKYFSSEPEPLLLPEKINFSNKKINVKDSGQYTCQAINNITKKTAEVNLNVRVLGKAVIENVTSLYTDSGILLSCYYVSDPLPRKVTFRAEYLASEEELEQFAEQEAANENGNRNENGQYAIQLKPGQTFERSFSKQHLLDSNSLKEYLLTEIDPEKVYQFTCLVENSFGTIHKSTLYDIREDAIFTIDLIYAVMIIGAVLLSLSLLVITFMVSFRKDFTCLGFLVNDSDRDVFGGRVAGYTFCPKNGRGRSGRGGRNNRQNNNSGESSSYCKTDKTSYRDEKNLSSTDGNFEEKCQLQTEPLQAAIQLQHQEKESLLQNRDRERDQNSSNSLIKSKLNINSTSDGALSSNTSNSNSNSSNSNSTSTDTNNTNSSSSNSAQTNMQMSSQPSSHVTNRDDGYYSDKNQVVSALTSLNSHTSNSGNFRGHGQGTTHFMPNQREILAALNSSEISNTTEARNQIKPEQLKTPIQTMSSQKSSPTSSILTQSEAFNKIKENYFNKKGLLQASIVTTLSSSNKQNNQNIPNEDDIIYVNNDSKNTSRNLFVSPPIINNTASKVKHQYKIGNFAAPNNLNSPNHSKRMPLTGASGPSLNTYTASSLVSPSHGPSLNLNGSIVSGSTVDNNTSKRRYSAPKRTKACSQI